MLYKIAAIISYSVLMALIWSIIIVYRFVRDVEIIHFDSNKDFMKSLNKVIKHHGKDIKYFTLGE